MYDASSGEWWAKASAVLSANHQAPVLLATVRERSKRSSALARFPFDPLLEANGERGHPMNHGFFPFPQKPSPLFRAGYERFFSLVQHEDHAFPFKNALTGLVTRFLRSVSPRECWPPALRDSSPPREPFRPCPLGCLHPCVPEPGTEEAFRGRSSCLCPTERLSPPTLVNPSLSNLLSKVGRYRPAPGDASLRRNAFGLSGEIVLRQREKPPECNDLNCEGDLPRTIMGA